MARDLESWFPRWAREMQTELDRAFGPPWVAWRRQQLADREWAPNVDLVDRPQELVVEVDLPGVERESIEVTLADSVLTIRAKRKAPTEDAEGYLCCERPRGTFHRAIEIPVEVDADHITAEYNDGVLRLSLPKMAASQPKKIAVATR